LTSIFIISFLNSNNDDDFVSIIFSIGSNKSDKLVITGLKTAAATTTYNKSKNHITYQRSTGLSSFKVDTTVGFTYYCKYDLSHIIGYLGVLPQIM
jgi:hypothetical protein